MSLGKFQIQILFRLKCCWSCLIFLHFSVIADDGTEVQDLGLLDLSKYKTVPTSDMPTYLLHRDQLPLNRPSGLDEDDFYYVNATPPVNCPYLSDDERERYRQMAEDWRSKGTSYPKKAAAKLRRKQLTPLGCTHVRHRVRLCAV